LNIFPLVTSVAFGGMTGFLIGYTIKKIMKILAIGVGISFTAPIYLESQNIVNINWCKLQTATQDAISTLANTADKFQYYLQYLQQQTSISW
jgi:uncharacterized membrane protein (Fun14 family)